MLPLSVYHILVGCRKYAPISLALDFKGTLEASCQLVRQCGGEVLQCLVVMELQDLKGKEKVSAQVESFIKF
uniref:Uncharacterized protein n=1 Tax=Timema douglasi TaxID=61478 RepID=A0A7R8VGH6_TIMDO|nr:unnamed protein product [Timema douglasi]